MIKLQELIEVLTVEDVEGDLQSDILGISYDSRTVKADYLFVAISGFKQDGHSFIKDAIANGATAVVVEKEVNLDLSQQDITLIKVNDTRKALAYLGAKFYDYPSRDLTVIGVTGTNGKTTTTYLIEGVLNNIGFKTGLIGTIKNKIGPKEKEAERTTPEALDLQRILAKMVKEGVTHVVMEVSSHALELDRVLEIDFDCQIFTNLSQDHLDFHRNFDQYLAAKLKLFKFNENPAIINFDDPRGQQVVKKARGKVVGYGIDDPKAEIRANRIQIDQKGVSYLLQTDEEEFEINLKLTGRFNVYNSLAAIGAIYSLGVELEEIKKGIEETEGVPGRFQIIDEGQPFGVIVDYAHAPAGMENVLKTADEITEGRKIIVFGCGGDRDRKKRPIMGKIGANLADFAIVTSDNPRSEDPLKIIEDIEVGIKEDGNVEGEDYIIIEDRAAAIKKGIELAQEGDLVIIVGKGHETYQEVKGKILEFDDRKVAREILQGRGEN
ncbi:UDP-N-acetylmuramoyl-L-alanyl-D-glutamate--2,6-diaminopimelate ligase [Natroniella sulfidigena]|uniref:UDP-N-acetylmuramoyl-L-alanyl-D-glutamate--2, 6-diaminopimelate ligase n=1 Tax=Natroniella sulfidigena TaxID=723921 RepID=UPI00200A1521|nr:UDP-N-acetylmuramoyl-L-alanyl-D-glutamate--2,6-diaminopimelate ligase [Natroniella sulfidigena]MCK8817330.1 UDP-N-acetylmuramoyl-L-alanyl-D-glutamate--2,6-diaminopimelate ligase [Natroniella sulfidigena]